MGKGYLPRTDSALLSWSINLSDLVNADPAGYGLGPGDAAQLQAVTSAYASALTAATDPATRTIVAVAQKNTARSELETFVRPLVQRIRCAPGLTAAEQVALGIAVAGRSPTPVPPPASKPIVTLIGSRGDRNLLLRLVDEETPTRRARPRGALGAEVYTFSALPGQSPPADLEQWRYEGLATRCTFSIDFAAQSAGRQALLVARWINAKGQAGPASDAIRATVPGTMLARAA